jgi:hypothetical protein
MSGPLAHVVDARSGQRRGESPVIPEEPAKLRKGLIELRDVGGWFKVDRQLYVGGRRQTKLVDDMSWQVEAVRHALGTPSVLVHPAVCFVDGEWGFFPKPIHLKGVLVCWPKKLVEEISSDGSLGADDVLAVAARLAGSLPAKTSSRPPVSGIK